MARWVPPKWNNILHKQPYYKGNSYRGIDEAALNGKGIDIDVNCSKDRIFMATHWAGLWVEKFRWTEESFELGICTKDQIGDVCNKKVNQLTAHQISTLRTADGYGIVTAGSIVRYAKTKRVRVEFDLKFTPTVVMLNRLATACRTAHGTDWRRRVQIKTVKTFLWRTSLLRAKRAGFITFLLRVTPSNLNKLPWYVDFARP